MAELVGYGGCRHSIAEDVGPHAYPHVRRHDGRPPLVPPGDELEDEAGPPLVDLQVAQLVQHRQRQMRAGAHPTKPSVVIVLERMQMCLLEYPGVALHTLNWNSAPSRPCRSSLSFQPDCSCLPGSVPWRGCASGKRRPAFSPRASIQCLKAPYLGSFPSGCLSRSRSCITFIVTPGIWALSPVSSLYLSKPLRLAERPSSISAPSFQHFATVCRSNPYLRAISEKLGRTPISLSISISPIRLVSILAASGSVSAYPYGADSRCPGW